MKKIKLISIISFVVVLGAPIQSLYAFGKTKPAPVPVEPAPPINPDPSLELGAITVGGSGCLKDTTEIHTSSDLKQIHLGLTTFVLSTEQDEVSLSRKACSVAIPFAMKEGKRLVLKKSSLSGKHDLSRQASGKLQFIAFLAGSTVESKAELTIGDIETPLRGNHSIANDGQVVSGCAQSGILRVGVTGELHATRGDVLNVEDINIDLDVEDCQ